MTELPARNLSIGEFSRASGLSIKTLRHYQERALLLPTHVEERSGYRYYSVALLERARIIRTLRGFDFSLEMIAAVLSGCEDDADVLGYIVTHKSRIDAELQRYQDISNSLTRIITHEQEAQMLDKNATFEIEDRQLTPQLVAGVRMRGRFEDCKKAYKLLGRTYGFSIAGKAGMLLYDEEFKESDADFEPFFPIKKTKPCDGIYARELKGGRALCLLHRGPYDQVSATYARLFKAVAALGLSALMPSREIYIKGPGILFKGNPKRYLTEVQILVGQPKSPA